MRKKPRIGSKKVLADGGFASTGLHQPVLPTCCHSAANSQLCKVSLTTSEEGAFEEAVSCDLLDAFHSV